MSQAAPNPARTQHGERLDAIDALRGMAALAVAAYHIWGHDGTYPWPSIGVVVQSPNPHWLSYLDFPLRWGFLGVSLFLVLSGFCIHLPQARKRDLHGKYGLKVRQFFLRRIWRLYPAYLLAIVATSVFLWILASVGKGIASHPAPDAIDVVTHLTFTHGLFDRSFYSIASIFWSLSLEFQLYLLYPIFLWLFRKIGILRSVALLTLLGIAWRLYAIDSLGAGLLSISAHGPFAPMGCVLARMPEWLFGAALAEWYVNWKRSGHLANHRVVLVTTSVVSFCAAIFTTLSAPLWVLSDPLFGISFTALIGACIFILPAGMPGGTYRWLVEIGVMSYSLYLFHLQALWIVFPISERLPGLVLPLLSRFLWLGLSLFVIRKIFLLVERPFLFSPREGTPLFNFYQKLQHLAGIKTDRVTSERLAEPARSIYS